MGGMELTDEGAWQGQLAGTGGMELTGDATGTGALAGPSSSAAVSRLAPPVPDAPVLAAGTGSTLPGRTVLSALASGGGGGCPQLAAAATSTAAADGGASQRGTGTPSQLAAGASHSGSVAW
jgi:hypothetical protein